MRGTGHVPSPLGAPIQQGSEGNLCQPRPGLVSQRRDSPSCDRSGSIWNSHEFYAQFLSKTFKCFVLFFYAIVRLQVTASYSKFQISNAQVSVYPATQNVFNTLVLLLGTRLENLFVIQCENAPLRAKPNL